MNRSRLSSISNEDLEAQTISGRRNRSKNQEGRSGSKKRN